MAKKRKQSKKPIINPSDLEGLDREALIKIIIQQGEVINQQDEIIDKSKDENKKLRQHIDELEQKVQQLSKLAGQLQRAAKRQAAPFRVPDKNRKSHPKRPGRKKGHSGNYRTVPDHIDKHIEVPLSCCPHCCGSITRIQAVEQFIEEIPPVRPQTIRLVTYKALCHNCGKVQSDHPLKVSKAVGAAKCQLGPRAQATAIQMLYQYHLTYSTTSDMLKQFYGISISRGGLAQLAHKFAGRCEAQYQELVEQAAQSDVLYADETSWYVGKPQNYLWFFGHEDLAVYRIAQNRKRDNIIAVIGNQYDGVLVSDCLSIYDGVNKTQQKCYAHHLKEISRLLELCDQSEKGYLKQVRQMLKTAQRLKKLKGQIRHQQYDEALANLKKQATQLLQPVREKPAEESIANRLRKQKDHLFTFLEYEQVDATNNLAERMLRPAVISRKVSCGNKTDQGANTWQILTSLITTNQIRNVDNDQYLESVARKYQR